MTGGADEHPRLADWERTVNVFTGPVPPSAVVGIRVRGAAAPPPVIPGYAVSLAR
jgi:hypothetical protein